MATIDEVLNELFDAAVKQHDLSHNVKKEDLTIKDVKIGPIESTIKDTKFKPICEFELAEPIIKIGDNVNFVADIPRGNEVFDDEYLHFLLEDIVKEKTKELEKQVKAAKKKEKKKKVNTFIFKIKKVEFHNPWTIVFWRDGSVTRVRCQAGESYDAEKGLAMAIIKHFFEDTSYYNEIFKKFVNKDDDEEDFTPKPVKKKKLARRQKKSNDGFQW